MEAVGCRRRWFGFGDFGRLGGSEEREVGVIFWVLLSLRREAEFRREEGTRDGPHSNNDRRFPLRN